MTFEVLCASSDDEWLQMRRQGIGASEIAAVLGENPWQSPYSLYAEKVGDVEPTDLSDVERVDWGKRLEPVIIDAYKDRTGRPVRHHGKLLRSLEYPWMLCTLDGETGYPSATDAEWPFEVKTTSAFNLSDWVDGAPEHYRAQAHQQMIVTGAKRCTIAALVGGQRLIWQDIDRDERLVRKIVHHGERFWRHVVERNPPPIDGSERTAAAIRAKYARDDGTTTVLDGELIDVVERLQQLKDSRRGIDDDIRACKNLITAALGDAERGVFQQSDLSVSWRTSERRGHTVAPSVSRRLLVHTPKH